MNNIFRNMIKDGKLLESTKIVDDQGQTILHYLCDEGDEECVMKLLHSIKTNMREIERNNFINHQDKRGNTAMHLATERDNNIIATMLDLYGADKTKPNANNKVVVVSSSDSYSHSSEHKPEIKCGDKVKMQKLIDNLTRATASDSDSYSVEDLDDIVITLL